MKKNTKLINSLSVILVSFGVLLGMTIMVLAVWADFEASFYKPALSGKKNKKTISCPVFITEYQKLKISATITNPIDVKVSPTVWTFTTEGSILLEREDRQNYILQPGDKQNLSWLIAASDAAYGNLILTKVYVYSQYPLPAAHGSCGVVVVNLPFISGKSLYPMAFIVSFVMMFSGTLLWKSSNSPLLRESRNVYISMLGLSIVILLGMLTVFPGWWLIGGLFFLIALLLSMGIISHFFLST